jgi:hypothetical protein
VELGDMRGRGNRMAPRKCARGVAVDDVGLSTE